MSGGPASSTSATVFFLAFLESLADSLTDLSSMEGRLSPRALSLDATCKALANLSLSAALSLITGRFALRRGPTGTRS